MTTIALSHGGTTTYAGVAPARRLLVGTADGVVVLERTTAREGWSVAHRALDGCHVSALVTPRPGLVVAGVFHDTVHVSRDDGETWERRGDGIAPANVYSLAAVLRGDRVRLYAGTEPAHLFVSDDLGASWRELPGLRAVPSVPRWMFPAPPHDAHVKHIVPDPGAPDVLYACIEQGALLRSRDGGTTWHELSGFDEDVHFFVIDPRDSRKLYMSGGNGCYASTDAGATWTQRTSRTHAVGGYPDTLVLWPRHPDVMFLGAAAGDPAVWRKTGHAGSQVCQSHDGGTTWVALPGFPRDMAAAVEAMTLSDADGVTSLYVGTTAGDVIASEDAGVSWRTIASGLPAIAKFGHDRALMGV
jgi:photosystem II stability/assembly factor-like uncharacterized protein